MRVKVSPKPSISLPPSTPPRFGTRGALRWTVAVLSVLFARDLHGQGVVLSATKYGADYAVSGSLWYGVQPTLYSQVVYPTSPWASDHYVFTNYVRDYRGHGRGHGRGNAWGHYKRACRDLFWDPWAWSWAGCGPYWRSGYWHPYGWVPAVPIWTAPVYVGAPVHHRYRHSRPYYDYAYYDDYDGYAYYDDDYYDDGYYDYDDYYDHDDHWSVDVHVSIGLGHDRYVSPWYPAWRPVYADPWYDPWARETIVFVDPGPRWVVRSSPRYVRAEPSPRFGSGGWVSQVGFKENPRGDAPTRTAIARPAADVSGAPRDAVGARTLSPAPSRAGSAEPRVTRTRVADVTPDVRPSDAVAREARPRGAVGAAPSRTPTAAPSRAEPEPARARGRVDAPRDSDPSADVDARSRLSPGRVATPSADRRRPEPAAAPSPSRVQTRAEPRVEPQRLQPQRAEPQRAEPRRAEPQARSQARVRTDSRGRVEPQGRLEPQARPEPQARAEPQPRAEPRVRMERQPQARAEPRGQVRAEPRGQVRAEPQGQVQSEPRAQAAPRGRDSDGGARVAAPSREPRSVRPQAAPSASREPRASRPSQSSGPSVARGRPGR